MIEHCIQNFRKSQEEKAYRVYVTDALKIITENTAHFAGGSALTKRWIDVIDSKPADTRTGDEIAADVIAAAGLKVKGGE